MTGFMVKESRDKEYKKLVKKACNLVFRSYTTGHRSQITGAINFNERDPIPIHSIRRAGAGAVTPRFRQSGVGCGRVRV
jgi:hypothetical protein